jgi:hypothetical protein
VLKNPGPPDQPIKAKRLLGSHDVLFLVFDTLRYDVAVTELNAGRTPTLQSVLPASGWEHRHAPATFTYAAHQAFFAGFLPTPATPGPHPRLFAIRFAGSETTNERTAVFDTPDIISGFASLGYHTLCIGGVGFFNPASPLGKVLPGYFAESHYSLKLGVTDPRSTEHQIALAIDRVSSLPQTKRVFLFINLSALHQPNCHYVPAAESDSLETHAAALRYIDSHLPPLFSLMRRRAPTLCILCSDHGTTYGEDGYIGHRCAHPRVLEVPYAEFLLDRVG